MDAKIIHECECAAAALYDGGWRADDFDEILERELEGIEDEIENRRNEYFEDVSDGEILADLKEEAEEKAKMICEYLERYEEEGKG